MFEFNRGISEAFVDRLNTEYELGGWWKVIADDRELFVAIRYNYINVYWKGNSLLKLWQEGNDLKGKIHYKYLLRPDLSKPYIDVINGQARLDSANSLFMSDFNDVINLKRAANVYAGKEKDGVHQIVIHNSNVIDVEIAFGTENEKTGGAATNRIDFAALSIEPTGAEIVFFEAKLFSNKELRTKGDNVPVLTQLGRYNKLLRDEQDKLVSSYQNVCRNLTSLNGIVNRYVDTLDVMKDIAENKCKLSICDDVRLVIFGFDIDQRDGKTWLTHHEKLKEALGNKLLIKGDPNKFAIGISHKTR